VTRVKTAAKPRRFRCEMETSGRSIVTFDIPAHIPDSEIPDDPEDYFAFIVRVRREGDLDFVHEEEIERGFDNVNEVEPVEGVSRG